MAVKIRMRRMGNKNKPFFRIVATDIRNPQSGDYLENLGWYDPKSKDAKNFELKLDRVDHWVKKGAILADSVRPLVRKTRKAAAAAPAAAPTPTAAT